MCSAVLMHRSDIIIYTHICANQHGGSTAWSSQDTHKAIAYLMHAHPELNSLIQQCRAEFKLFAHGEHAITGGQIPIDLIPKEFGTVKISLDLHRQTGSFTDKNKNKYRLQMHTMA